MITKLLINSTLDTQWLNSGRSPPTPSPLRIFKPNWGPKGRKKTFLEVPPPHLPPSKDLDDGSPLTSRSRSNTAEGIGINYNIPTTTETPWRRATLAYCLKFNLQYRQISFNRHLTKTYVCFCIILSVDSLKDEHIGLAGPKMSVLEGGDCLASFQMRKKIHIFVTRIKTYPSPSRVIMVSLYKGTTRPIVAL